MNEKWKLRYIGLAKEISSWSKDPSTKVGAIVVGGMGQILSQGYNGFPRNVKDDLASYEDKDKKQALVVHAEMNAIYNASHNGIALRGATMFIYGLPVCHECAKGIIQVGIKSVISEYTKISRKWEDSNKITESLFAEAGVNYTIRKAL
jgi:dCMP deaminase